eukprot:6276662-Amphidinium_carterae.1
MRSPRVYRILHMWDKYKSFDKQLLEFQKQRDAMEADRVYLKKCNTDLNANIKSHKFTILHLQRNLDQANKRLSKLEEQMTQLTTEINSIHGVIAQAESELTRSTEEALRREESTKYRMQGLIQELTTHKLLWRRQDVLKTKVLTSPYRSLLLPDGGTAWMRVEDAFIQRGNPYECPPLVFREEEVADLGYHSRGFDERPERPPPLPPPAFPDPDTKDQVEVVVHDEDEQTAVLDEPDIEEQVPVPPSERTVHFAEDLVQYAEDQVDSGGASGSGGQRTPSVSTDYTATTPLWYPTQCA